MKENSKVFFIDSVGHADGIRAVCDRHVSAQSALDGRIFRCNILTSPAWSDHQYDWLGYGAGASLPDIKAYACSVLITFQLYHPCSRLRIRGQGSSSMAKISSISIRIWASLPIIASRIIN